MTWVLSEENTLPGRHRRAADGGKLAPAAILVLEGALGLS
jgi:hypothetical protein